MSGVKYITKVDLKAMLERVRGAAMSEQQVYKIWGGG